MPLARFGAGSRTLKDLLNATGTGFYVPLYQRPYRWTSDDASRLIADVVDGIARFQRTGRSSTFLGSLITVDDSRSLVPPPTDRPGTVRQVIDGQQRIATLLGLCGELRRAIEIAFGHLGADEQAVLEPVVQRQAYELEMALSFKVAEPDDSILPRMIRGGEDRWGRTDFEYTSEIGLYLSAYSPEGRAATTGSRVFDDVIDTMRSAFASKELFDGRVSPLDADQWDALFPQDQPGDLPTSDEAARLLLLLTFAAFTMGHVQVISVEAEDEDSAFAVFEPLNTTGKPLTAFETFVPSVVYTRGGQREYAGSSESVQVDRFNALLHGLTTEEAVQRTKKALVAFALADTGLGLGEQLQDQRIYLRRYLELADPDRWVFLEGLANTAECLANLWYEDHPLSASNDHTKVALRMLIDARHTIPLGLLARGYEEFREEEPRLLDRLVRVVADFWLLWRLSRSTTANIDGHHRSLMAGFDIDGSRLGPYCRRPATGAAQSPDPDAVAGDFRKILEAKGGINDRETWVAKASELAHGSHGNKALLRYALLGAYHDAIPGAPPEMVQRGVAGSLPTLTAVWYDAALTVEHIAPQTPLGGDNSFGDQIYRESRVHRLGNLTLLPQEENRILGNKSWPEKQQYFKVFAERDPRIRTRQVDALDLRPATVDLLSERLVPFCTDLAELESNQWTEAHIAERGKCLAELIWDRFAPSLGY